MNPSPEAPPDGETRPTPRAAEFMQYLEVERAASVHTRRNYGQAILEFQRWQAGQSGSAPVWETLERDVFRYYLRHLGRQGLKRASIQLRFSALRSFYKFLVRRGIILQSPVRNIALPKAEKRNPVFLTREQMTALLGAPDRLLATGGAEAKPPTAEALRDKAVLETLYSCGLRVSELCALEAGQIDWNETVIRVIGKGRKERQLPVGQPALQAIRAYWSALPETPGPGHPVFYADDRRLQPIYPRLVQLRLKKYLAFCGLDRRLTPHKIRHSYATHILDAGADLRSVQELLGHAHLSTTQIYTHVTLDRLKKAYDDAHPRARGESGEKSRD